MQEREIYDKPTSEKIDNINFFKNEGNNYYKNGRYAEACYFYQKAIIYGDYTFPDNPKDTARMEQLLAQSNCNFALSNIKLGKWDKVKTNLIEASKTGN